MTSLSRSPIGLRKAAKNHLRILVLGSGAVGKTAMTVRFITRRFIGEYDPTLEQKYVHETVVNGDHVTYEIMDTAGQMGDSLHLDEYMRWADAFLIVYSVTDRCSFEECTRFRFLIHHGRKCHKTFRQDTPVYLVANQNDLQYDRMVSSLEGKCKSKTLECSRYYDISVRESYEEVCHLFHDICKDLKIGGKKSRPTGTISPRESKQNTNTENPNKELTEFRKQDKREKSVSKRLIRVLQGVKRKDDGGLGLEYGTQG